MEYEEQRRELLSELAAESTNVLRIRSLCRSHPGECRKRSLHQETKCCQTSDEVLRAVFCRSHCCCRGAGEGVGAAALGLPFLGDSLLLLARERNRVFVRGTEGRGRCTTGGVAAP